MTPYAHPILPLLIDTSLARVALPKVDLPARFSFPRDAVEQVERGVALYRDLFGQEPRGMWPAEGAVAQEMVGIAGRNGMVWMASDEGVLAKSLDMAGFSRDSAETVQEADVLYRPYYVTDLNSPPVAIVFRQISSYLNHSRLLITSLLVNGCEPNSTTAPLGLTMRLYCSHSGSSGIGLSHLQAVIP